MSDFSHLNKEGKTVMVDIGEKTPTRRSATARTVMGLPPEVINAFSDGDIQTKKGSVVGTAILAGIMAAKKTSDLIPLCHTLALEDCQINISFSKENELVIECTASTTSKTGVEMEALVGATIAALTVYDMCKALSHDIVIKETRLISKSGGKKDFHIAQ
ncbi:MAG: cyclic pyranopterin monophosphate synthase MoaC [Saprospiraceae bacterium]